MDQQSAVDRMSRSEVIRKTVSSEDHENAGFHVSANVFLGFS